MLRITRLSDYAIVVLASAAKRPGVEFTARLAAEETHLPLPAVKKILKSLASHGIVESQRGISGGYWLARAATQIALADIIDAVEGPFALTECGQPHPQAGSYGRSLEPGQETRGQVGPKRGPVVSQTPCEYLERCAVQSNWGRVNGIVRRALASVTLADMIGPGDRKLVSLRLRRQPSKASPDISKAKDLNAKVSNAIPSRPTIDRGKAL